MTASERTDDYWDGLYFGVCIGALSIVALFGLMDWIGVL